MKKLTKSQIKKAKVLIKKMGANIKKSNESKPKLTPIYDDSYFKTLAIMDGEES